MRDSEILLYYKFYGDIFCEWEKKLGVTRQEVEDLVSNPEQIVAGDMDVLVAQARTRNGLLRVPFIEIWRGSKSPYSLLDK